MSEVYILSFVVERRATPFCAMECVYDCSHPLWGGAGACIKDDDPAIEESCVCDVGYVPRDSFGNPSCVPKQVRATLEVSAAWQKEYDKPRWWRFFLSFVAQLYCCSLGDPAALCMIAVLL